MAYIWLHRKWRARRSLWYLLPLELFAIVACLAMFGISQPNTYRTLMWEIGGMEKFNSSPNYRVYFYANYRPVPAIPFVWSQTLTDFNVAISILSLFIFIAKLVLIIMRVWRPLYSCAIHFCLVVLYIVSMYGQMGPDHLDPRYPSSIAWYIRKSCSVAAKYKAKKSCEMAKGTFAATVIMIFILLVILGMAVWSMLPNPANDIKGDDDDDDVDVDDEDEGSDIGKEKGLELRNLRSGPASPRPGGGGAFPAPFTPRTQAFHTLDRKLPLR